MTEVFIILVVTSGAIYLYRLAHRRWCRLTGREDPAHTYGPLPVQRAAAYVRDLYGRVRRRFRRCGPRRGDPARSTETE